MAPVPRDLVERLYAAHPDGFIAARDEAAAAARAARDPAQAREISRLRKPTVAAWLVNLLALRRPDLLGELVGLAEALRSAQRELRGPRLRELSTRRRELVGALVAEARSLARQTGPEPAPGKLPLAEVEATLHAALADEEVAQQVRSGRLVRPASYAGFGEVPRPRLRLLTGGAGAVDEAVDEEAGAAAGEAPTRPGRAAEPARTPRADRAAKAGRAGKVDRAAAERTAAERGAAVEREEKADRAAAARAERERAAERAARRRALDRELTAARREQQRAEEELERVVAAQRAGTAALAELESALAELERRRAGAENEVSRCKLARKAAERALVSARRHAGEVQAAVEALEAEGGSVRDR